MEEFYPKEYFLKFLLEMRDIHKSRDWHELGDMTDQQIEWEVDNYIRLRDERGMDWLSENENESFIGLLRAHK